MNIFTALHRDPRLSRLDKESQDLVLALAEELSKGGARTDPAFSPLLKSIGQLQKADPQAEDLHVSTELTDRSIGFFQSMGAFTAAGQGVLPVAFKNDLIRRWNRGDLYRDEAQLRPVPGEAAGGAVGKDTASYIARRFAWKQEITDEDQRNDRVEDPSARALRVVTQKLLIRRDAVWADTLFKSGVWTTDLTGVAGAPGGGQFQQWDQAASTPRDDLLQRAVTVHELTGYWPNVLHLQPHVLVALLLHADITDAFKFTVAGATPSLDALASALFAGPAVELGTVPRIAVVGGVKTSSEKGAASDTFTYIGGKHALLSYVDVQFGLLMPTAYTVPSWEDESMGTNEMGVRIKTYEDLKRAVVEAVEGEIFFDVVVTAADLGLFFDGAVA